MTDPAQQPACETEGCLKPANFMFAAADGTSQKLCKDCGQARLSTGDYYFCSVIPQITVDVDKKEKDSGPGE